MLSPRTEDILRSITKQYIEDAMPVSSAGVIRECKMDVCSATVRNEMVVLEEDGYIIRPHHSSGSIPSEKGYRYYVDSLKDMELPEAEQLFINHLFHQVEMELEEWLELAASLMAKQVHNVAVVTMPRQPTCKFHHLELVSLQGQRALAVLILRGAKVRQQLITFTHPISQEELTAITNRTNEIYGGLTSAQIKTKKVELSVEEQQVSGTLLKMMQAEDRSENDESYLDGLHFMLEQPEFNKKLRATAIAELVEQHRLGRTIIPQELDAGDVQVIIGQENKEEVIRDYSVVLSRYGLPNEVVGTIGVLGPTRMHYGRAIAAVSYLSVVMTRLMSELYGYAKTQDADK
jgi:heat-inducible transcriptional repressor